MPSTFSLRYRDQAEQRYWSRIKQDWGQSVRDACGEERDWRAAHTGHCYGMIDLCGGGRAHINPVLDDMLRETREMPLAV